MLLNTIIAWLVVCVSIASMFFMFHVSHFSKHPPTSWSSSCYDVFCPKGVQLQLDGWPWNGEGVWGAKGDVWKAQCLGYFQPRQG